MSVLIGGGGIKGGRLIGSTNRLGEVPQDQPLMPGDLHHTLFKVLGVDPHVHYPDLSGRPIIAIDHGAVINEFVLRVAADRDFLRTRATPRLSPRVVALISHSRRNIPPITKSCNRRSAFAIAATNAAVAERKNRSRENPTLQSRESFGRAGSSHRLDSQLWLCDSSRAQSCSRRARRIRSFFSTFLTSSFDVVARPGTPKITGPRLWLSCEICVRIVNAPHLQTKRVTNQDKRRADYLMTEWLLEFTRENETW